MTTDTTPDANRYAPPEATLVDPSGQSVEGELPLASRGARFGAAFIDGIIQMVLLLPVLFLWFASWEDYESTMSKPFTGARLAYLALGLAAYLVVNAWWLRTRGQTVGKRLVGIRIVSVSGQLVPLGPLLLKRWLPFMLLPQVPFVGILAGFVDLLMIFRSSRRCLHDQLAGTIVVDAVYRPANVPA